MRGEIEFRVYCGESNVSTVVYRDTEGPTFSNISFRSNCDNIIMVGNTSIRSQLKI